MDRVEIKCLNCGRGNYYDEDSHEATGVFNAFCDGECEDGYAAKL